MLLALKSDARPLCHIIALGAYTESYPAFCPLKHQSISSQ